MTDFLDVYRHLHRDCRLGRWRALRKAAAKCWVPPIYSDIVASIHEAAREYKRRRWLRQQRSIPTPFD